MQEVHRKNEVTLSVGITALLILKCSTINWSASPSFSMQRENMFDWPFSSCHKIQKILSTEIQGTQIQGQLFQPLSWSSLWMIYSYWLSCQVGNNQKHAAKIAEPVLPKLKAETFGPLQSIMPMLGCSATQILLDGSLGPGPACLQCSALDRGVWY